MAVAHIQDGGTRTSGASTAGDWSQSNCYDISAWSTVVSTLGADGDEVIFDDQRFVCDDLTINFNVSGRMTLSSRSGGTTLLVADSGSYIFVYNDSTPAQQITLNDLAFDGNGVTWAATGNPLILVTQNCTDIQFNRCTWQNITAASGDRTVGLLARIAPNVSGVTVGLTDCVAKNITVTITAGDFDGLFKVEDNDITWTVTRFTGENINLTCATSGSVLGWFYQTSTAAFTLNGIRALNCTHAATYTSAEVISGIYNAVGTPGTVTITDVDVENFTFSGTASTSGLFEFIGAGTLDRANVKGLYRTGSTSSAGNSVGGLVVANGADAVVVVQDVLVQDGGGFFGQVVYNTGGGTMTARRCRGVRLTDTDADGVVQVGTGGDPVNGLAFYCGGSEDAVSGAAGNAVWEFCAAIDISGTAANGIAVYAHHPDRSANTAKSCTITNMTVLGTNSTSANSAVFFNSAEQAGTFTVSVYNSVFDNPGLQIEMTETGAGSENLTVVIDGCVIPNGTGDTSLDDSDLSNGSMTATNIIALPSKLTATGETYKAAEDSPIYSAVTQWRGLTSLTDAAGRQVTNPPAAGAIFPRAGRPFIDAAA